MALVWLKLDFCRMGRTGRFVFAEVLSRSFSSTRKTRWVAMAGRTWVFSWVRFCADPNANRLDLLGGAGQVDRGHAKSHTTWLSSNQHGAISSAWSHTRSYMHTRTRAHGGRARVKVQRRNTCFPAILIGSALFLGNWTCPAGRLPDLLVRVKSGVSAAPRGKTEAFSAAENNASPCRPL